MARPKNKVTKSLNHETPLLDTLPVDLKQAVASEVNATRNAMLRSHEIQDRKNANSEEYLAKLLERTAKKAIKSRKKATNLITSHAERIEVAESYIASTAKSEQLLSR